MKRETKNKLFALFILLAFLGSTIAYSISFVLPHENKVQTIFNRQLSEEEEVPYLKSNFVVLRFYYTSGCCADVEKQIEDVYESTGHKLLIERVDISKDKSAAEWLSNRVDYDKNLGLPAILLRGRTEKLIQGNFDSLFADACDLYFEEIPECM